MSTMREQINAARYRAAAAKAAGHEYVGVDPATVLELCDLLAATEAAKATGTAGEIPSFAAGQTYESSKYGPLVFERIDTYYGETTYQFFWTAENRKRWIKPDDLRHHFCAEAARQPAPVAIKERENE